MQIQRLDVLTAQSPHITYQAMASSIPDGRTGRRRTDGRTLGWIAKTKKKYFSEKKGLSCRTGPGRTAFSVLWTLFPVLSDGSAGCPKAKKYFSKKKVLIAVPYHDLRGG